MKQELSSLDIKYLADELQYLKGGRLQKFYQVDRFILISLHAAGRGTQNIVLGDGMFHTTKYSIKKPEKPTNFAMVLRKYLKGARIEKIYQHEFERILIIDTGKYLLIAELFSKGNIIFADKENYKIWSVLEHQIYSESRKLKIHGTYVFPPASKNINAISE
ncbi:fibronectin-binding domain-containing protein, partial [archaeon]|nr:fibronectin-binding domain-containing protein [archaeon]